MKNDNSNYWRHKLFEIYYVHRAYAILCDAIKKKKKKKQDNRIKSL